MSNEEVFSVCQWFMDGSYDYEVKYVDMATAAHAANRLTSSVGARMGITQRVIITDGGDCICWEWVYGKGVVFPTPEQMAEAVAAKENSNG